MARLLSQHYIHRRGDPLLIGPQLQACNTAVLGSSLDSVCRDNRCPRGLKPLATGQTPRRIHQTLARSLLNLCKYRSLFGGEYGLIMAQYVGRL